MVQLAECGEFALERELQQSGLVPTSANDFHRHGPAVRQALGTEDICYATTKRIAIRKLVSGPNNAQRPAHNPTPQLGTAGEFRRRLR